MEKAIGTVYTESWRNAYKFKANAVNRELNEANVRKIEASFKKYGWVGEPVTVDRNYHIIAGHHRVEAAIRARIPIKYIIEDVVITPEALQDISRATRKWTGVDYIDSLAKSGSTSHSNYMQLYNEFVKTSKVFSTNTVLAVVTRCYEVNNAVAVQSPDFSFTLEQYIACRETLTLLQSIVAPARTVKVGRFDFICRAALFLLDNGADTEVLRKRIESNLRSITAVSNVEQAVQLLEDIYNKRTAVANRKYFASAYKEYIMKRNAERRGKRGKEFRGDPSDGIQQAV